MNQLHWQNNRNTNCTSLTVQRIGYGRCSWLAPACGGRPGIPTISRAVRSLQCRGRCHMSSPNRFFTMLSISGSSDRRQSLVTGYAGRHEHAPVQRNVSSCDFVNNSNSFVGVLWAAQRLTRWRHNRVVVSGAELCPIL